MQPSIPMEASVATSAHLRAIGDLALQRHHAAHQQHPRRAAAAYLRAALTCARELARHAKRHPAMRDAAVALITTVIAAATQAEATCFAAGGNSAPYLAVLIAAEGLRGTLADAPAAPKQQTPSLPAAEGPPPEAISHSNVAMPSTSGATGRANPGSAAATRASMPRQPKRRHRPNKRAA